MNALPPRGEVLLTAEGIGISFGGLRALDGVGFSARAGEVVAIIGPNGAGKTTLFNCLSRLYQYQEGDLLWEGKSITNTPVHEIASLGIGRTFQNLAMFRTMSVEQNIMIGAHSRSGAGFLASALGLRSVDVEEASLRERAAKIMDYLKRGHDRLAHTLLDLMIDNYALLVDELHAELATLRRHWQVRDQQGQPLLTLLIGEPMLEADGADALIGFLQSLGVGLDEPEVQIGPLAELLPRVRCTPLDGLESLAASARPVAGIGSGAALTVDLNWEEGATRPLTPARAAALEHEEDAHALQRQLARSRNPYEQIEILGLLVRRGGARWGTERGLSVWQMTQALYERACRERHWGLIRRAAAVLDVHDTALEEAVAQIVARQKRIVVGRSYGDGAVIDRPLPSAEIFERIRRFGGDDARARVLLQEVVLLLGTLIKADAPLLRGTLTLRAWYLILLITGWLAREHGLTQAEGFDFLLSLSPQAILRRLREVIAHEQEMGRNLQRLQSLHGRVSRDGGPLARVRFPASADPVLDDASGGWLAWREVRGVLTRLPEDFHARVWEVLRHFPGLVIGDQLDSRNRLDSHLARADMTASERGFALQVDDLLNKIHAPEYRQLTIEALIAVSDIARANPDLAADGLLVMDVLIGIAVRLGWEQSLPARPEADGEGDDTPPPDYNEHKAAAWQGFYALPPHRVATLVMDALVFLMTPEMAEAEADQAPA